MQSCRIACPDMKPQQDIQPTKIKTVESSSHLMIILLHIQTYLSDECVNIYVTCIVSLTVLPVYCHLLCVMSVSNTINLQRM